MKPICRNISLTILALTAGFVLTARANGLRAPYRSSAALDAGHTGIQQFAPSFIKAHHLWSDGMLDNIIYDNGGPDQQNGNEMTEWIQAEDFTLTADSTLTSVNFWDIEEPGGGAYQGEIDWVLYTDAGGQPGAAFASGAAVGAAVTRTFIQCCVLGTFDEYSLSFNISPGIPLTAGTTYWLGLHNGPLAFTNYSFFYWETTAFNGTYTGHEDDAPFDGAWLDNLMEHAFNLGGGAGGGITLTADVIRHNGNRSVILRWSPADGGSVNVLRNGSVIGTTDDDGYVQKNIHMHTGTDTYQVCETESGDCSNIVTVTTR
jgi:hypothetical protein